MYFDESGQRGRRELWFRRTREHIDDWINPDGSGKIPQFNAPYREPIWILPALYSGDAKHIELANRIVARYQDTPPFEPRGSKRRTGKAFNIFQTNCFSELFYLYRHVLTPAAEDVMRWHAEQAALTFAGSAQPDFVFRGGNDNMPAHATCGLVMAGQAIGDARSIEHARWNLRQLRQVLARCAWMGEYNSPTYTALTLTSMASIAEHAVDEEIRELALGIEHRIWAEVLLHYHPGTFHHAGPMSRAYIIGNAGHNGDIQLLMWLAFGPEATGRDLIESSFHPKVGEIVPYAGCAAQFIAELTYFVQAELHVPDHLAHLATQRRYPDILRGRTEHQMSFECGAPVQTETYMSEAFSLGTCDRPMTGGEGTASLYATYRRKPELSSWRDAATVFVRYSHDDLPMGIRDRSDDGKFTGERSLLNQGWCYAAQKENVAVLLTVPNLRMAPVESSSLKLSIVFPAHFGQIAASIIGDRPRSNGAVGASDVVEPVSVETGEVFIHVQPLIPTSLPRAAAVRFSRQNDYEVLEMVNYEGEPRVFDRIELSRVLNGMVFTIDDKHKYASLEAFHEQKSKARLVDYLFVGTRYFEYLRDDVWFRIVLSTDTVGAMTELIDGLPRPAPIMESNQIDLATLPFLGERSTPNIAFFPWDKMEIMEWANSWIIGSRGLPGEQPYSNRIEALSPEPDGPRRSAFPKWVEREEQRRRLADSLAKERRNGTTQHVP